MRRKSFLNKPIGPFKVWVWLLVLFVVDTGTASGAMHFMSLMSDVGVNIGGNGFIGNGEYYATPVYGHASCVSRGYHQIIDETRKGSLSWQCSEKKLNESDMYSFVTMDKNDVCKVTMTLGEKPGLLTPGVNSADAIYICSKNTTSPDKYTNCIKQPHRLGYDGNGVQQLTLSVPYGKYVIMPTGPNAYVTHTLYPYTFEASTNLYGLDLETSSNHLTMSWGCGYNQLKYVSRNNSIVSKIKDLAGRYLNVDDASKNKLEYDKDIGEWVIPPNTAVNWIGSSRFTADSRDIIDGAPVGLAGQKILVDNIGSYYTLLKDSDGNYIRYQGALVFDTSNPHYDNRVTCIPEVPNCDPVTLTMKNPTEINKTCSPLLGVSSNPYIFSNGTYCFQHCVDGVIKYANCHAIPKCGEHEHLQITDQAVKCVKVEGQATKGGIVTITQPSLLDRWIPNKKNNGNWYLRIRNYTIMAIVLIFAWSLIQHGYFKRSTHLYRSENISGAHVAAARGSGNIGLAGIGILVGLAGAYYNVFRPFSILIFSASSVYLAWSLLSGKISMRDIAEGQPDIPEKGKGSSTRDKSYN